MERKIQNAIIKSTKLGRGKRGIMTCFLYVNYGGAAQAFGGYGITHPTWEMEFITQILDTVGVNNWEDLPGTHIRTESDFNCIYGIGHIIEDKWFYPDKTLAILKDKLAKFVGFNINNDVFVKLNPSGLEILDEYYKSGFAGTPTNGYYQFQAHHLMEIFGSHVGPGFPPPFKPVIRIAKKDLTEK